MTPACIYCGGDAGEYDEHDECVEASIASDVEHPSNSSAGAIDTEASSDIVRDTVKHSPKEPHMTTTATACTVTVTATGGKCGAEGVYTFTGTAGETFVECAEHFAGEAEVRTGREVGERVEIRRYGRTYIGTIVRVGARGAAYAEFAYGNGAKRVVAV